MTTSQNAKFQNGKMSKCPDLKMVNGQDGKWANLNLSVFFKFEKLISQYQYRTRNIFSEAEVLPTTPTGSLLTSWKN